MFKEIYDLQMTDNSFVWMMEVICLAVLNVIYACQNLFFVFFFCSTPFQMYFVIRIVSSGHNVVHIAVNDGVIFTRFVYRLLVKLNEQHAKIFQSSYHWNENHLVAFFLFVVWWYYCDHFNAVQLQLLLSVYEYGCKKSGLNSCYFLSVWMCGIYQQNDNITLNKK